MTATTAALQCQGCYNARTVTKYTDPDGRLWWLCDPCREYNVRLDKDARAAREAAQAAIEREARGQAALFTETHPRRPEAGSPAPEQETIDL